MVANRLSTNKQLNSQIAQQTESEIAFFSKLSFLTRSMQLFGLYFVVDDSKTPTDGDGRRTLWSAGRVYTTLVLVILWLNLARMMSCFDPSEVWGPILLFKLYAVLVFVATNLMMTCYYVAYSNGKLNHLLGEIARYNLEEEDDLEPLVAAEEMFDVETPSTNRSIDSIEFEDGIVPSLYVSDGSNKAIQVKKMSADIEIQKSLKVHAKGTTSFLHVVRQSAYICAFTAWTVFLLKISLVIYILFWTPLYDTNLTPIMKYVTVSPGYLLLARSIVFIITTYIYAAGSFVATMSLLFALLFWQQFKSFNSRFKAAICGGQFQGDFELYRLRHQRLSHLVEKADKMLWVCNGGNIFCNSVSTIVLLYALIFYVKLFHSNLLVCHVVFYLLTSVYEILLTSFGAILVNNVVLLSSNQSIY